MPPWEETGNEEIGPWNTRPDASKVSSGGNSGSLAQMLFPSAYSQYQDMKKEAYSRHESSLKDNAKLLMKGALDFTDVPKRILGGDVTNPQSNIWSKQRDSFREWIDSGMKTAEESARDMQNKYPKGHWTDALSDSDPDKYLLDPRSAGTAKGELKVLRSMGDMFFEFAGDPFFVKDMVLGLMKKAGNIGAKGASKESLKQGGFEITPSQALDKPFGTGANLEKTAQMNPFTQKITEGMKGRNVNELQNQLTGISTSQGGQGVEGLTASTRGKNIEKVAEETRQISKDLYGKGEDVITSPLSDKPASFKAKIVETKPGRKAGAEGPAIAPETMEVIKTDALQKMDNSLASVGHKIGDKVKNIGNVSDKTIKQGIKYRGDISDAKTVGDLVRVKRNIAQETFDQTDLGFFKGDANQAFLKGINGKLNDAVSESITKIIPGKEGSNISDAYKSINAQYANTIDVLSPVTTKLGLGKKGVQAQNVIDKINLIGVEQLEALKKSAKDGYELRAIYDELSRGSFESVIKKSINAKTGKVSPDKFRTEWGKMDDGIKGALFDDKLVKDADELVSVLEMTDRGDILKLNPSGTAKMNALQKIYDNKIDAVMAGFRYLAIKHYYKTGKLYRESAVNLLSKTGRVGSKALGNKWVDRAVKAETFSNFFKPEVRE